MSLLKKLHKYCKWFWDESLGGEYDTWGTSTYFMEVGYDLCALFLFLSKSNFFQLSNGDRLIDKSSLQLNPQPKLTDSLHLL